MLRFRTFGTIDLRRENGERLEDLLGQPKRLALLAYLADRQPSGPVRREQVLSLLWPESAPSAGRHALSATLSRLRKRLGDEVLSGRGEETIALSPDHIRADVIAFQRHREAGRLREAFRLYRGTFLEGFRLADAREFEEWVQERRETYRRQAYEAALEAAEAAREANDETAVRQLLERAVEIHPLKEGTVGMLLRVLAEQGERTEALQRYRSFRERLENELDLSPSGELEALADRLRSEPGSFKPEPKDVRSADAGGPEAGNTDVASSPERSDDSGTGGGLSRPIGWVAALLLLVLFGGGLWYGLRFGDGADNGSPAPDRARRRPTVAVLPFDDLSDTEETRPLLQGLHSELLTRLSGVSDLAVVSRSAVLAYRNADLDLSEVADSLNAEWVVEGGLQQLGDRIRVDAQLINPETETQLWAESYRRELTASNLFEIQEELAEEIVRALDVELTPEDQQQVSSVPTENTAAYELYLQAKEIEEEGSVNEENLLRKTRLYRRALELDSTFAEAWAGLADAFVDRAWSRGWDPAWADSGRIAAERSIALDPDLANAHAQLGDAFWVLGEEERQREAYRRALELQPGHRTAANNLIVLLARRGEYAEKLKWLDRIRRISPHWTDYLFGYLEANLLLGRDSVVEEWWQYVRDRDLSLPEAEFTLGLLYQGDPTRARRLLEEKLTDGQDGIEDTRRRAALALYEGDWERARRLYRRVYSVSGGGSGLTGGLLTDRIGLAWSLDQLGRREDARRIASQVLEDTRPTVAGGRGEYALRHRLAAAHLLLGDTTEALDWLEEAVDIGEVRRPFLQSVPTLAPVRDHSRFRALMERMRERLDRQRRRVEAEGWGEPPDRLPAEG